jgi:DNA polymerase IIIc chi subunit
MTEVLFYTHVDDKLRTACTLTAKALARGMRVMDGAVHGFPAALP